MIRQSTYYQQLPELIISCDDLDGSPENIPIIFEDNYVSSNNEQQQYSPLSSNSFIFSSNDSVARKNSTSLMFMRQNSLRSSTASKQRKSSFSSNEMSMTSAQHQQQQQQHLSDSSNKLHKRLKKKIINGDVITNDKKKAVQLVSYRKVNDYFNDQVSVNTGSTVASTTNTDSGGSSNSVGSGNSFLDSQQNSVQSKLNKIKADLSTRVLTPPGSHRNISSSISNNNSNNSSLQSIIESKQLNKQAASATDLFRKNFNQNNQNGENSPSTTVKLIKQQSVSNSTSNNQENLENKPSFQSLTNLSSTTSDYSSMTPPNNNHKTTTDNNEHDYLDNEIPDTLNQIDISIKSDDTTLSDTTNSDQFSTSENKNNNNKQGPSDCSFKSRALYESFRGKPSTLERPRAKSRMNLGNLTNNDTLMKRNRDTSKKTIAEFLAMEDEDDDLIENRLEKSINSIQIDDNKLRKTSTGRVITPLKRQLTINTDKNSLSAILNENLFK
jgi:trimeric autotransporter adhesin